MLMKRVLRLDRGDLASRILNIIMGNLEYHSLLLDTHPTFYSSIARQSFYGVIGQSIIPIIHRILSTAYLSSITVFALMGNTSIPVKKFEVVRSPTEPDLWKLIDSTGYCEIMVHLQTELVAESYTVPLDLRLTLQDEYQKYEYRRTQDHHLIKVYEITKANSQFLCSGIQFLNVKTQRIEYRLSEIRKLSDREGVYLLYCSLLGYKQMKELLEPFRIDQNMIGLTPHGEVKVWLNENIAKNYPELEYELNSELSAEEGEKAMVLSLLEVVLGQIKQDFSSFKDLKARWQKKTVNTFEQCISLCKQIIFGLGIEIKNVHIDMVGISKKQQVKGTEVSQSIPMEVSDTLDGKEEEDVSFKIEEPILGFIHTQDEEEDKRQHPFHTVKTDQDQSPMMPTVTSYNPITQSSEQIIPSVISPPPPVEQKVIFPAMNQSKSKGKPPKPAVRFQEPTIPPSIPPQVIEAINEIQRSRSQQLSKSQSQDRIRVAYANTQSIKPSQSPVKNRLTASSKSESNLKTILNESLYQTQKPSKSFQVPSKTEQSFLTKPYTAVTFGDEPLQPTYKSFQKPFVIEKPLFYQKISVRNFEVPSSSSKGVLNNQKCWSVQKPQYSAGVVEKTPFEFKAVEKFSPSWKQSKPYEKDIEAIINQPYQSIKQPSFGQIPQSIKPLYTQTLPSQLYKGALQRKLDLSQYTYNM